MPEDISAAERMVRDWQERATEKAERFGRMQEQVEQISVTESSRDGAVQVRVGSNGLLQNLELTDKAANRPMATLAAEIMRAVQVAQGKIPERMQQAVGDTVGTEDPAAQFVLGQVRKHFPEPPDDNEDESTYSGVQEMRYEIEDDEPSPTRSNNPPSQPRRDSGPDDPDDFSSGSFLR